MVTRTDHLPTKPQLIATTRHESPPACYRLSDARLALGVGLFSALSVSSLGVMVVDLVAILRHLEYAGF